MYAAERQQLILTSARTEGRAEVGALAERLDVSTETIRRDLTSLERRGLLQRVHGGAIPVDQIEPELGLDVRVGRHSAAKQRIALRALEELPEGATVLLDSGTTTLAIAQALPANASCTVITNSLVIGATLASKPGIELLQLGGRVRPVTGAVVGPWTCGALSDLTVDIGFFGANGFDAGRGLSTPDQDEAAVKRAMVRAARTTVLVSDSSKAGRVHLNRFADFDQIDLVITDSGLDPDIAEDLRSAGPTVVMA